jgi:UDP:flavonoid glycosyltransferase YjiC (YdhE family)
MNSKQIRFIFVPLGSAGDVNPMVWLARLVADRGHEPVMVIQTAMADYAERAHLRFRPTGSKEEQEQLTRNPDLWHPFRAFPLLAKHFPEWAREMLPVIRSEIVPGRTVLVGAGIAFAARIAAESALLPLVTVQLQPSIFMSPQDTPVLMRGMEHVKKCPLWFRKLVFRLSQWEADRQLAPSVNRLREESGLGTKARGILHRWGQSPDLVLGLFPEWFGPRQPDWPPQIVLTRFPLFDEATTRPCPPEWEAFSRSGTKPILFTPGSANMHGRSFFEAGMRACQALGQRAAFVTPFAEHLPSPLAAGMKHFEFLPFSRVFHQCAAVVHHGGIGTCAQGLAAGVPQLLMAMAHDQPDNGWRLRQLGTGDYLYPNQFTAERVQEKLKSLTTSVSVANACRNYREEMQRQMPTEAVADILERLALERTAAP